MATTDPRIDAYIERAAPISRNRSWCSCAAPCTPAARRWSRPSSGACRSTCTATASSPTWRRSSALPRSVSGTGARRSSRASAKKRWASSAASTTLRDLPPKRELVALVKQAVAADRRRRHRARARRNRARRPQPDMPTELASRIAQPHPGAPPSRPFRRASDANTSSGSPRPNATRHARGGWRRPSNGSPKAKRGTGSTRAVDAAQRGESDQTPPRSAAAPSSRSLNRCAVSERIAIACRRGGTSS